MYSQAVMVKFIDAGLPCVDAAVPVGRIIGLTVLLIGLNNQAVNTNLVEHVYERAGTLQSGLGLVTFQT